MSNNAHNMPTKPIEKLLFAQGGRCFFCQEALTASEASVEHLVAKANGGGNSVENTVACCKALNTLLGHMALKEKLRVILNQNGVFKCPGRKSKPKAVVSSPEEAMERVVTDLRKRGSARPRTLGTLKSSINNLFQNGLSPEQLDVLVGNLNASGVIAVNETRVPYALPANA